MIADPPLLIPSYHISPICVLFVTEVFSDRVNGESGINTTIAPLPNTEIIELP